MTEQVPEEQSQNAQRPSLHERMRGAHTVRVYPAPGLDEQDGDETKVGCRVLVGAEMGHAIGKAKEWARKHHSTDPREGDPAYDLAYKAAVVAMGVVEPVTDGTKPKPLYSGGFDQVINELDDDQISYLYAIWEQHRELFSPLKINLHPAEFIEGVRIMAGGDEAAALVFFSRLPPGMQVRFTRLLAVQYVNAVLTNSSSSSASTDWGNTSSNTDGSQSDKSTETSRKPTIDASDGGGGVL